MTARVRQAIRTMFAEAPSVEAIDEARTIVHHLIGQELNFALRRFQTHNVVAKGVSGTESPEYRQPQHLVSAILHGRTPIVSGIPTQSLACRSLDKNRRNEARR